jgi:hypothetical protein
MNKFFNKLAIGVSLGLTLFACSSKAGTATVTVLGGTMTNLFSFTPNQGSVLVKQVIVSPATGVVPQLLSLVDTPTNLLVFTTLAYSNKVSYATNYVVVYTNFYGVVTSNNWYQAAVGNTYTNYELVDITNSVPQATNNYNVRFSVGVVSNSPPIVYSAINQYYDNGIWVTNAAASGSATVTIVW